MIIKKNVIDDAIIVMLLKQNISKGWEQLYDKYAPMMYGAILRIVDDKELADEILIRLFILIL